MRVVLLIVIVLAVILVTVYFRRDAAQLVEAYVDAVSIIFNLA